MALTKQVMAQKLIDQLDFTKKDAKNLVEEFFEELSLALEQGEVIKLSGFGNFQLPDKAERPGRNPKTGEDAVISARRVTTFRPGKTLNAKMPAPHHQ